MEREKGGGEGGRWEEGRWRDCMSRWVKFNSVVKEW